MSLPHTVGKDTRRKASVSWRPDAQLKLKGPIAKRSRDSQTLEPLETEDKGTRYTSASVTAEKRGGAVSWKVGCT